MVSPAEAVMGLPMRGCWVGHCTLKCSPYTSVCVRRAFHFYRQVLLTSCFRTVLFLRYSIQLYSVWRCKMNIRRTFAYVDIPFSAQLAPVHTSTRRLLRGNESIDTSLYPYHGLTVPLSHKADNQPHSKTCLQYGISVWARPSGTIWQT